jgi:hypothetical protein
VLGGACPPIYRLREALESRHDNGDGQEVAVSGRLSGEDLFSPLDRLGRETIRARLWSLLLRPGIPIVDENGVYWRCRGVELGEVDDDDVSPLHEF